MEANFDDNELYSDLPNLQLFSQHIRAKTQDPVFTSPQQSVDFKAAINDSQKKSSDIVFVDTKDMQVNYDGLKVGTFTNENDHGESGSKLNKVFDNFIKNHSKDYVEEDEAKNDDPIFVTDLSPNSEFVLKNSFKNEIINTNTNNKNQQKEEDMYNKNLSDRIDLELQKSDQSQNIVLVSDSKMRQNNSTPNYNRIRNTEHSTSMFNQVRVISRNSSDQIIMTKPDSNYSNVLTFGNDKLMNTESSHINNTKESNQISPSNLASNKDINQRNYNNLDYSDNDTIIKIETATNSFKHYLDENLQVPIAIINDLTIVDPYLGFPFELVELNDHYITTSDESQEIFHNDIYETKNDERSDIIDSHQMNTEDITESQNFNIEKIVEENLPIGNRNQSIEIDLLDKESPELLEYTDKNVSNKSVSDNTNPSPKKNTDNVDDSSYQTNFLHNKLTLSNSNASNQMQSSALERQEKFIFEHKLYNSLVFLEEKTGEIDSLKEKLKDQQMSEGGNDFSIDVNYYMSELEAERLNVELKKQSIIDQIKEDLAKSDLFPDNNSKASPESNRKEDNIDEADRNKFETSQTSVEKNKNNFENHNQNINERNKSSSIKKQTYYKSRQNLSTDKNKPTKNYQKQRAESTQNNFSISRKQRQSYDRAKKSYYDFGKKNKIYDEQYLENRYREQEKARFSDPMIYNKTQESHIPRPNKKRQRQENKSQSPVGNSSNKRKINHFRTKTNTQDINNPTFSIQNQEGDYQYQMEMPERDAPAINMHTDKNRSDVIEEVDFDDGLRKNKDQENYYQGNFSSEKLKSKINYDSMAKRNNSGKVASRGSNSGIKRERSDKSHEMVIRPKYVEDYKRNIAKKNSRSELAVNPQESEYYTGGNHINFGTSDQETLYNLHTKQASTKSKAKKKKLKRPTFTKNSKKTMSQGNINFDYRHKSMGNDTDLHKYNNEEENHLKKNSINRHSKGDQNYYNNALNNREEGIFFV